VEDLNFEHHVLFHVYEDEIRPVLKDMDDHRAHRLQHHRADVKMDHLPLMLLVNERIDRGELNVYILVLDDAKSSV
jgi:hypothetical protein